jgi:hypothetical protein
MKNKKPLGECLHKTLSRLGRSQANLKSDYPPDGLRWLLKNRYATIWSRYMGDGITWHYVVITERGAKRFSDYFGAHRLSVPVPENNTGNRTLTPAPKAVNNVAR